MADLFEAYEEEFNELRLQIEQRTRNLPTFDGAQRRNEYQLAENDLKSLEQTLRQMNLSGRSTPRLMGKVKEYEQELVRLKSALRRADMQVGKTNDRNDLFSGIRTEEVMAASMSSRERLITANDRLEKVDYEIDNANRVALETVDVGIGILTDLDTQTDKMKKMRVDMSEIEDNLDKAKRIMKSMARRAWQNKLILAVIALVLVAAIALIIYVRWFAGKSSTPSTTTTGSTTGLISTTGNSTNLTSGQLTTK